MNTGKTLSPSSWTSCHGLLSRGSSTGTVASRSHLRRGSRLYRLCPPLCVAPSCNHRHGHRPVHPVHPGSPIRTRAHGGRGHTRQRQAPPGLAGRRHAGGHAIHLKIWGNIGVFVLSRFRDPDRVFWPNPSRLTRLSRIRPYRATTGIRRQNSVGPEGQRDDQARHHSGSQAALCA